MSWMKGNLLSKSRRLVGGLASREPLWLKAMESSPPPVFPSSNGKIKKIVLPEDTYVRRFSLKHPQADIKDPSKVFSAFVPDPTLLYGCRVLELTQHGISEDDAMSIANVCTADSDDACSFQHRRCLVRIADGLCFVGFVQMEYLSERKVKKKAYKRLKELAIMQDKVPPPKPYLSAKKEMQSQEKKPPTETPSVRRLVNQLKQQKDVLLQDKAGGNANHDHWIDE
ncbi:unnamed protein product [Cochlearia groenlandica]